MRNFIIIACILLAISYSVATQIGADFDVTVNAVVFTLGAICVFFFFKYVLPINNALTCLIAFIILMFGWFPVIDNINLQLSKPEWWTPSLIKGVCIFIGLLFSYSQRNS